MEEGTKTYYSSMGIDAFAMTAYQTLMRGVGDRLRMEEGGILFVMIEREGRNGVKGSPLKCGG